MKLAGWVLSISNLFTLVTSLTHYQRIPLLSRSTTPSGITSAAATKYHRHRYRSLRLAPRPEQQDEDDTPGSSNSVSDFEQTGGPIKFIVGGLTDLFVRFSGERDEPLLVDTAVPKVGKTRLEEYDTGYLVRRIYVYI